MLSVLIVSWVGRVIVQGPEGVAGYVDRGVRQMQAPGPIAVSMTAAGRLSVGGCQDGSVRLASVGTVAVGGPWAAVGGHGYRPKDSASLERKSAVCGLR